MRYKNYPLVTVADLNSSKEGGALSAFFNITSTKDSGENHFEQPSKFEGGAFGICLAGSTIVSLNLTTFKLEKGNILIVSPGSIVRFGNRSDDFEGYMAAFSLCLIKDIDIDSIIPFYSRIVDEPLVKLTDEQLERVVHCCDQIKARSLNNDNTPYFKEIIKHMILVLFYEISSVYEAGKVTLPHNFSKGEAILKNLRNLIIHNFRTQRSVKFYADQLGLTPNHISAVTKELCGMTVGEIIDEAVIFGAKIQLMYSEMSVNEVSEHLNFPNPSFFTRFFKHHTGMTPKEFRKTISSNTIKD